MKGKPTIWSTEMIEKLVTEFPIRFSREIGKDLGLSLRTIVRKARELNLEKEPDFLDIRREQITELCVKNRSPNPSKGDKTFRIPGAEKNQFKKGEPRPNVDYGKVIKTRNETIKRERLRIKYGLKQQTKLKLTKIY
ncbi:MAG: hypothetical protein ABI207_03335 [Crocinitomicaceae bacterium]